jgi:cytochrome c551/c552
MKKILWVVRSFALVGFAGRALLTWAAPVEIQLPHEVAAFKQDVGAELANAHCLTCHSVEYVTMQPPLPRTFWKSSIQKMQEKYGAAIPADQIEPMADYLSRNYGAATNRAPMPNVNVADGTNSSTNLQDGQKLATKYGCSACHSASSKLVGPALREIAAKYKNDPDAKTKIGQQIHSGGSGKWGPLIMPPFPQIPSAEKKVLTEWILNSGETK